MSRKRKDRIREENLFKEVEVDTNMSDARPQGPTGRWPGPTMYSETEKKRQGRRRKLSLSAVQGESNTEHQEGERVDRVSSSQKEMSAYSG